MKDKIYAIVCANPGIDTPKVCFQLHDNIITESGLEGWALAKHLMTDHRDIWEDTCTAVDALLDENAIVFTDGGKLYQVGYQGEVG